MERQSRCHDYQRVPSGSIFYWLPIGCCRLPLYGLIGLSRLVSAREFANRQFPETRTRSNLVSNLNEVCRRRSTPLSSLFPSALLKQNCAYLPSPFPAYDHETNGTIYKFFWRESVGGCPRSPPKFMYAVTTYPYARTQAVAT